jgi:NTP pyrophosphatase (non-canonical NTP hydrolase)
MEINTLSKVIHANAVAKGFYEEGTAPGAFNVSEKLMLVVSELAEAQEADRIDRHSDYKALADDDQEIGFMHAFEKHVKNTYEDELADTVIRVLDLAAAQGIDLEKAIALKMRYNETRPHKHGKKY